MVMENIKGSSNPRNAFYNGKQSLLPPKSPFPSITPSYLDYVPSLPVGPRGFAKPREMKMNHQRTSSESFLMEDQPSWLDELLNEPETPVRKGGHRRSSSDSFAYLDVLNASNLNYVVQPGFKSPSRGPQDFEYYKDGHHASFYKEANGMGKPKSRSRDSSLVSGARSNGVQSARENGVTQTSEPSSGQNKGDGDSSTDTEKKQDPNESGPNDPKAASDKDIPPKPPASDSDTKRAKQQFAQRSRVRKLQYIAELERTVQALQADVSEISSELGFLNQQNLILSMENKALKQRLDSTAQEQLIKRVEHEVLEREIGRLRALCQQQRQPPPSHKRGGSRDLDSQFSNLPSHKRSGSRDLDAQFSSLSLKHQDAASCRDPISGGPLRN